MLLFRSLESTSIGLVLTSGEDRIFPKGLLIGTVTDFKPALLKNKKPALICVADNSIFAAQLEDLHKQLPLARYELFPGAGHTLFVDEPDKFNALLEDFLHDLMMR